MLPFFLLKCKLSVSDYRKISKNLEKVTEL